MKTSKQEGNFTVKVTFAGLIMFVCLFACVCRCFIVYSRPLHDDNASNITSGQLLHRNSAACGSTAQLSLRNVDHAHQHTATRNY